jgi:hypothetical protein
MVKAELENLWSCLSFAIFELNIGGDARDHFQTTFLPEVLSQVLLGTLCSSIF